jgi:hypothetical protein
MVDFRKSILLLAILLVASSAAMAQNNNNQPFQCTATGAAPPIVRAEGLAEFVGDVILDCFGGVPTPIGTPVPLVNVRILLNTNVTSALLSGSWTESILAIDDPDSPLASSGVPGVAPLRGPHQPVNTGLGDNLRGTGNPTGINYKDPFASENLLGPGQVNADSKVYNVFQGNLVGDNQIEWTGVPIDPPGTQQHRVVRITNVRANANAFGVSGTFVPAQLTMFVSATSTTGIIINNPTQVVAIVQDGMTFDVVGNPDYLQCLDNPQAVDVCDYDFLLRFRENFPTAFNPRGPSPDADIFGPLSDQVTTESNYRNVNIDSVFGNTSGLATQGTRLFARFKNLQAGVSIRVWRVDKATDCPLRPSALDPDSTIRADWVSGASSTTGGGGTISGANSWTSASGNAAAWEIRYTGNEDRDSFTDTAIFAVDLVWVSNTTADIPGLGTSVVAGTYAPLSTQGNATSYSNYHPRFVDDSTDEETFTINSCSTSLLWPYITNQAGFDTGMVISNTSMDPWGNNEQDGPCVVHYYGFTMGGGPAPAPVPIPEVLAGEHAIWTLSSGGTVQTSGGTIAPVPGFQGYAIAICEFQYAHGYAFISDIGASKLAQGYLALIISGKFYTLPRDGSYSEPLNQ